MVFYLFYNIAFVSINWSLTYKSLVEDNLYNSHEMLGIFSKTIKNKFNIFCFMKKLIIFKNSFVGLFKKIFTKLKSDYTSIFFPFLNKNI